MCLENVPCKAFYSGKNEVGTAPKRCGIHSKPQPLLQKTCLSYAFKTLAAYTTMCLCTHALARIRSLRLTYASRWTL